MPLLALGFYLQHERPRGNWAVTHPVKPLTRFIALGLGGVLLVLGIAILLWPAALIAYWPWPTTPLLLRIFAAWFSAFGVGLLWFQFDKDWKRLHLIATLMVAASGLDLLMLVIHRQDLTTTGLSLWVYVFHLASFGLVGLFMHWLQREGA